ncbi:MAG: c-type cytochrome [Chitinophagaceae bacterium]
MKTLTKKLLILVITVGSSVAALADPPVEEGKAIFSARCASCHNISKDLTGPALKGIDERRSMDWIVSFVKSSQSLVKAGDKDAVAVFEKFNKIPMPDHPDLTDENIQNVVAYIKSESSNTAEAAAPFAKPSKLRPAYTPLSTSNYGVFIGFLSVVGLLILAMLMAVQFKQYERQARGTEID